MRVRDSGAVAAMDQEALEMAKGKAVRLPTVLLYLTTVLVAVFIADVVVVFVVLSRIALGASCTKYREATIALDVG